jgi:hypothetical protein
MIFFQEYSSCYSTAKRSFLKKQDRKTECIESCAKIGVKFGVGWGEVGMRKRVSNLLFGDCLSDLAHDEIGLDGAAGVDGPTLLLSGHAADVGSNVVQDGRLGNVDNIGLVSTFPNFFYSSLALNGIRLRCLSQANLISLVYIYM